MNIQYNIFDKRIIMLNKLQQGLITKTEYRKWERRQKQIDRMVAWLMLDMVLVPIALALMFWW